MSNLTKLWTPGDKRGLIRPVPKRMPNPSELIRGLLKGGAPDWFITRMLRLPRYQIAGGMPEGRLAHIGFAKETTFGTYVAPTRYFMFESESVETKVHEVIPQQITGFMDEGPSYPGLIEHSGKIKIYTYPESFGAMLLSYGADALANPPTFSLAAGSSGSLATATYYVRVAAIYGDANGVTPASGTYIGHVGVAATEQSVSVTGPSGSVTVTITAPTQGATPVGYIVYYANSAGNENIAIVTTGLSATITTLTVGGAVVSALPVSGASIGVHTYSPRQTNWGANSIMQPFSFEIHRDMGSSNAFQYSGGVIAKMLLSWGVKAGGGSTEEALSAELDVIAKHYVLGTATTPTYDALANLFLWNQCVINYGELGYVTIADIKIDLDYGVEGKAYIDGTKEIHSIVAKGPRIVTVTGTMLADINLFNNYTARTRKDMNVVFTGPVLGTNGNYILHVDGPQAQIIAYPIVVPGFQEIMTGFTMKLKFDSSIAQTPALITLVNDVTVQY